jgi:hypothetical protein
LKDLRRDLGLWRSSPRHPSRPAAVPAASLFPHSSSRGPIEAIHRPRQPRILRGETSPRRRPHPHGQRRRRRTIGVVRLPRPHPQCTSSTPPARASRLPSHWPTGVATRIPGFALHAFPKFPAFAPFGRRGRSPRLAARARPSCCLSLSNPPSTATPGREPNLAELEPVHFSAIPQSIRCVVILNPINRFCCPHGDNRRII